MLIRVEVRTRQGVLLSLPLDDPSSGLYVQNIEGLDPVKATLVSSSFAMMDGEQFHSARRESRNVKLTLGLEPDYMEFDVRDLRKRLYAWFMPKQEVNLRFIMEDGLEVDIWGRVETFDAPMFTKEPAVDVSLMCYDPDFVDRTPVALSGTSTSTSTDQVISYGGTVETGFEFTFQPTRAITEFTIYTTATDGVVRTLEFAYPMQAGDVVKISTIPGAKGAVLNRIGSEISALYGITPQSAWLELQPGDNLFRVYAEGEPVLYTLNYTTKYGGL